MRFFKLMNYTFDYSKTFDFKREIFMVLNYLYNKSSIIHDSLNSNNEIYDLGCNFIKLIMIILESLIKLASLFTYQYY